MTTYTKPHQITNFDDLINLYEAGQERWAIKHKESYWLRYLFRRIPIFSALGVLFFGGCFLLTLSTSTEQKEINSFLLNIKPYSSGYSNGLLTYSCVLLLLRTLLPWNWFYPIDSSNKFRNIWKEKIEKPCTFLLLVTAFFSGYYLILSSDYSLYFGLLSSLVIMFGTLLADRSLGFTRRNERFQLFFDKTERLIILSRSRKEMQMDFSEKYIIECLDFFDSFSREKQTSTISDSFYALTEPLKAINNVKP